MQPAFDNSETIRQFITVLPVPRSRVRTRTKRLRVSRVAAAAAAACVASSNYQLEFCAVLNCACNRDLLIRNPHKLKTPVLPSAQANKLHTPIEKRVKIHKNIDLLFLKVLFNILTLRSLNQLLEALERPGSMYPPGHRLCP